MLRGTRAFIKIKKSITSGCSEQLRNFASTRPVASNLIDVDVNSNTGVATLSMNNPPVNSLGLELLEQTVGVLDKVEKGHKCTGIIWTSKCKGAFCAGLNFAEIVDPEEAQLRRFWTALQEMSVRVYGCPLPTVAAINGHCMAGGVIFAAGSDHRIMADGRYKFGLNESAFGVVVPYLLQQMYINLIGLAKAEPFLKLGTLFTPQEAHGHGLIDELVTAETLLERAEDELNKWIKIPAKAFSETKRMLREPALKEFLSRRSQETDLTVAWFMEPAMQKTLKAYLDSLKRSKKQ